MSRPLIAIAVLRLASVFVGTVLVLSCASEKSVDPQENRGPTATITVPSGPILEGSEVTFDASRSTDPEGDRLSYLWSFGDGISRTSARAPRTYADEGSYDVTLIVSDRHGASDTATTQVSVENAAPIVVAIVTPHGPTILGTSAAIQIWATDPGVDDGLTIEIDWMDGDTSTLSLDRAMQMVSLAHTYSTAGDYAVQVTVRDDDGAVTERAVDRPIAVVPYRNHPPVARITGYPSGREGAGYFFSAAESTDPDGDSLRVTWLSGDGRRAEGCIDATAPGYAGFNSDCVVFWTYPENGTYVGTVIVADDSGAADTASMSVAILNARPGLRWHSVPGYQAVGRPVSIALIIDDPGTADTHTIAVDWGDGTSETVAAADTGVGDCVTCSAPVSAPEIVSHSYATTGAYSIRITIRDDDGGDSTAVIPSPVVIFNPNARTAVSGYEAMDLGTLGANSARPADLNNRGQVVGTSMTASGAPHAFLWDETGMQDLGTLGQQGSEAVRINDDAVIAGTAWTRFYGNEDDGLWAHNIATIWKNGVGSALGGQPWLPTRISQPSGYRWLFDQPPRIVRALNASGEVAWAQYSEWAALGWLSNGSWQQLRAYPMAMNDRGQVVGGLGLNDGDFFHAFLWDRDTSRQLAGLAPQPCGYYVDCSVSVAMDINEGGQVVGISRDAAQQFHFVLWEDDTIKDLGPATWAPPQSAPRIFINERGEIVGSVAGTAFLWSGDRKVTLPSAAGLIDVVGINSNGEAAGTILTGTAQHAFVWSEARGMVDLGTGPHGFNAAWVVDINERGDVVGYSAPCVPNGNRCRDRAINLTDPGWAVPGAQVRAILWRNTQAAGQ